MFQQTPHFYGFYLLALVRIRRTPSPSGRGGGQKADVAGEGVHVVIMHDKCIYAISKCALSDEWRLPSEISGL